MEGSIFFSLFAKELRKGWKGGGGILLSIFYVLQHNFYKNDKIALVKKENKSLKSFV